MNDELIDDLNAFGKRLGSQSPTRSVFDASLSSLYEQPFLKKVLSEWWGFTPLPFQELLLRHSLAVDNPDSRSLAYKNFSVSLPRQNGKTEFIEERLAVALTVLGERAVYTSMREESAKAIFDRFLDKIEAAKEAGSPLASFFPNLPTRGRKEKLITSVDPRTGKVFGQVRFNTRKGGAGRGKSESLIILDEAQDLTRGERDALTAGIATFKNGQVFYVGTPEPAESASTRGVSSTSGQGLASVFGEVRQASLKGAVHSAWFEWGIDKLVPASDKDAWYIANPALGYDLGKGRGIDEKFLESRLMDDESFAIEHLGFWGVQEKGRVIEFTRWMDQVLNNDEVKSFKGYPTVFSVKSTLDGSRVFTGLAVKKSDEEFFVEVLNDYDTSVPWVDSLYKELDMFYKSVKCKSIIIDGHTAVSSLIPALIAKNKWRVNGNKFKQGKVTIASPGDLTGGAAFLINAVNEKKLFHGSQSMMNAVVKDAGKRVYRSGGGFGFSSLSGSTIPEVLETIALALSDASKLKVNKLPEGTASVFSGGSGFGEFKPLF